MSCRNCCPVVRNHVGQPEWEIRFRTSFDGCRQGVHGPRHNQEFNAAFHALCGSFIEYVDGRSPAERKVSWVGDIGVTVCKPGFHGEGRAFDLSAIVFLNGEKVDTNTHWDPGAPCEGGALFNRRLYVGVAAAARQFVGTVLTAWYNADHQNHIHFDDGVAVGPIRMVQTDITLIQASCNSLNGESLVIDGIWGPLTDAAYGRLLARLRMQCRNPLANTGHAIRLLDLIATTGLHGAEAGAFTDAC